MQKSFYFLFFILTIFLIACGQNVEKTKDSNQQNHNKSQPNSEDQKIIYSERIDGPANVRSSPNGTILFSLNEDAIVDVGLEKDGWYPLIYSSDLDYDEFGLDSIKAGRFIIHAGDTSGTIIKTHSVSTAQAGKSSWAILHGYTHKDNIKEESIIENRINEKIQSNDWSFDNWKEIIRLFDLKSFRIDDDQISTFYKNESVAIDYSPGLRILLIFEKNQLVGILHSRSIQNEGMNTHAVIRGLHLSFVTGYSIQKQRGFIHRFEQSMIGAD